MKINKAFCGLIGGICILYYALGGNDAFLSASIILFSLLVVFDNDEE